MSIPMLAGSDISTVCDKKFNELATASAAPSGQMKNAIIEEVNE